MALRCIPARLSSRMREALQAKGFGDQHLRGMSKHEIFVQYALTMGVDEPTATMLYNANDIIEHSFDVVS